MLLRLELILEYFALILFTISTSITPGPNNLMILSSGVNHGFRSSLPHLIGIEVGFPLMIVAVGMGFSQIFDTYPILFDALKLVGVLYLSYMAYKIASSPVAKIETKKRKPFSFIQAVLFQWVNPKAWIMCIGAIATFTSMGNDYLLQVITIALLFILFGTPCTVTWLWFGTRLQALLSEPSRLRAFNILMGLLLFASVTPVILEIVSTY